MPVTFGAPGSPRTITVAGELDLDTSDELIAQVRAAQGDGDLVLEFGQVTFIDSSGVRALLRAADRLASQGRLIVRDPSPPVRRVLELMGLTGSRPGLLIENAGATDESPAEQRTFPADRRVLGEIRHFVRSRALSGPVAEWTDNIVLAVSEACANAILHSGTPEIAVTWRLFPDRAEVEIRDEGIFVRAVPAESQGRTSRGILLMMAVMDQITITCGTDARPGTVVRMVKLKNGRLGDTAGIGAHAKRSGITAVA
jgi:anti-anti-sigma factor